jgi:hypothetical protein
MLSKQSIRSNVSITLNEETTTKDHLIELSKEWSEREETLFRKMLKQGGNFKIQDQTFKISLEENTTLNSRGNFDAPIKPMDHSGDNVDPNYIRR